MKVLWGAGLLLMAITTQALTPLPLSPTQITKLQAYFPSTPQAASFSWQGDPLIIALPLHQEKRVIFPERISVDVKGALSSDQLAIVNNHHSLYLTALQNFTTTRLYVTLTETHQVWLLDIQSEVTADATTVTIESPKPSLTLINPADTYVALIRYAWQQLYAPAQLREPIAGVARVAMHSPIFISNLVYGHTVITHPLASWSYKNMYLTAVVLRNAYPTPTTINVQQSFCGQWRAVSLYPRNQLSPLGHKDSDSTTALLISDKPFLPAMEVCHASP